jgi:uncharacterized protein YyaL (SSP411 family)
MFPELHEKGLDPKGATDVIFRSFWNRIFEIGRPTLEFYDEHISPGYLQEVNDKPGRTKYLSRMRQDLVDLYEATLDPAWVREARAVADQMIARFWDKAGGGFYQTPAGLEDLVTRIKRGYDGALPNSAGVAARALQVLALLTGRRDFFDRAETTLKAFHREIERAPTQAASLLVALDFYLGPVLEIVVVGREDALDTRGLLEAVRRRFLPRRVVAWIDPKSPQAAEYAETIPLVRDRPMADGQALAYVCENSACRMPVASVPELEKLLPVPPHPFKAKEA